MHTHDIFLISKHSLETIYQSITIYLYTMHSTKIDNSTVCFQRGTSKNNRCWKKKKHNLICL